MLDTCSKSSWKEAWRRVIDTPHPQGYSPLHARWPKLEGPIAARLPTLPSPFSLVAPCGAHVTETGLENFCSRLTDGIYHRPISQGSHHYIFAVCTDTEYGTFTNLHLVFTRHARLATTLPRDGYHIWRRLCKYYQQLINYKICAIPCA
ncbi:hypothetical protein IF1G_10915 [Cordyceps javanica]|uniref:Uncharacterized protein n=1 Tax=Cordyceps javanica TaxID=43265 RepID=A0A545ULU1_9HYPO|nr:hypothetical protein IF1G_10915 [Cordyceps javanica]